MRGGGRAEKMVGTYNGTPVPSRPPAPRCASSARVHRSSTPRSRRCPPSWRAAALARRAPRRSAGRAAGRPGPAAVWGRARPCAATRRRAQPTVRRSRSCRSGSSRKACTAGARPVVRVGGARRRRRGAHARGGRSRAGAHAGGGGADEPRAGDLRADQIGIVVTDIEQAMRRYGRHLLLRPLEPLTYGPGFLREPTFRGAEGRFEAPGPGGERSADRADRAARGAEPRPTSGSRSTPRACTTSASRARPARRDREMAERGFEVLH